jgi:acetyltransferase
MGPHYLDRLFSPHSIAVFGASDKPDSVGGRVLANLQASGFGGPLYPVNPKYATVAGLTCYPSVSEIGAPVDLALIAIPAASVAAVVHECGERGVRAAVVYSAGFRETPNPEGEQRERDLVAEAGRSRMRVLGPNCLGLIRPDKGLNATFSRGQAQPGTLALVSQSGALCTAILDWASGHGIGFSALVSIGSAADIDFGDILDYLAVDAKTHAILLYVEGIRHARHFLSALRVAARMKPVVVIKAGRHDAGARAALSHTGALVGADDVFEAALARAGAVRAQTVEQLFAAAQLLAMHHRVRGDRLAIVSNAGGPAVLAADRAMELNLPLARLGEATMEKLDGALSAQWSHGNPVDILGDAPPERYRAAVEACLGDPGVDGLVVLLSPQAMTDPVNAAQAVIAAHGRSDKPVLACWMGETQVRPARETLAAARIPEFPSPESAVEAFAYLAAHHRNQQLLLQVPGPRTQPRESDVEGARLILEAVLEARRSQCDHLETRAMLTAFGIPVMPAVDVHSPNEALAAAELVGYPVALKILSPDIVHKSDVDGVRLNVGSAQAVRSIYRELVESVGAQRPDAAISGVTVERMHRSAHGRELHVGMVRDPVFGPVISFGLGGTAIEVLRDRVVALPPLNNFIARCMVSQTRAARLLDGFRNMPAVNREALEQVLLRFSEMVCELPELREFEINPLLVDEHGAVALDARILIEYQPPNLVRYSHMAIHPYPAHLETDVELADGTLVRLRPIRPEDAEIEQTFVRNLSPRSKYFRFMQSLRELTPAMLVRFTQLDYDRELAFIAVINEKGREVEVAVARYGMNPDGESCEFAVVVADEWQGKGLGTRIMSQLMLSARARGFKTMEGQVLADNTAMLELVRELGFVVRPDPENPGVYLVTREL